MFHEAFGHSQKCYEPNMAEIFHRLFVSQAVSANDDFTTVPYSFCLYITLGFVMVIK